MASAMAAKAEIHVAGPAAKPAADCDKARSLEVLFVRLDEGADGDDRHQEAQRFQAHAVGARQDAVAALVHNQGDDEGDQAVPEGHEGVGRRE